MNLFTNVVTLRGFLGKNAEVPLSKNISNESVATLTLATVSGVWDLGSNEWKPRTDWHRILCPGPYFCGFVRGMRRGAYLEIEGELRERQEVRFVAVAGKRFPVEYGTYALHALRITRLDRPDALVDFSDSDDDDQPNTEVQP